jgi:hypothetical protein
MKRRPILRVLPMVGVIIAMAGFILAPATPAAASHGPRDLTVTKAGTGTGTVTGIAQGTTTSVPVGGINCGLACAGGTATYTGVPGLPVDSPDVLLTATPAANSSFAGWTHTGGVPPLEGPGCSDLTGSCLLELNSFPDATAYTATFNLVGGLPFPNGVSSLQVSKLGAGSGTVTSTNIGGINCGPDCSEVYNWGTGLTLAATPNAGSSFGGWNVSGGAANVIQNGSQISLNLNWPYWDGTWPWNWNNGTWSTLVTATFNSVATVAPAAASTFTHLHQHGGRATGRVHHGVYHAKKHVHTHTHAL